MLTIPYVTVPEFRAHPTYLDTQNLRVGGTQTQQDAALDNALLTASQWADDEVNMPLAAHQRVEQARVFIDRQGRIRYHPEHAPVITVDALATGPTPDELSTLTNPQTWTEQDGRIILAYGPAGGAGLATLQFGAPTLASTGEVLVRWTYTAGFPHTQLAAAATTGATSVTVLDATGISPGTVLRLWTPGLEEAVTVTAVAGTMLTVGALTNAHPAGMSITALPSTARQAVINYAVAELLRPAPTAEQNFSSTGAAAGSMSSPSSTSKSPGRGGASLVAEARRLLQNYQRVR